ncbi:twitching motility protein PilT [Protofrankia symbiont of Coriaria ruscifolia]|uniref:PilT protein domain-containing protein n=1 Tax=Candidatus Protofrankia californiensis TaxID=1839754 RepID=A0A1C3PFW1_9ACTN|nr:twitching motility protein PilT [Protofrankia symbiont of Coriaria ruscifolia]SBW28715.1 PilT protein domain-containing protein [Candidatus Protofrankia californiensis]
MKGLLYDAGALIAAEQADHKVWAMHAEALEHDVRPIVPAPALAQVWRGGPQPNLSRLLKGCDIEPLPEETARAVGALLARAGTSDIVDATVVVNAAATDRSVLTSDASDLRALAEAHGTKVNIYSV